MSHENAFSSQRRSLLGGVAALAATGAVAKPKGEHGGGSSNGVPPPPQLSDPRELYAKPPFERQSQEWPGLASKMNPKPDHGEQSYRGRGRLAGRKALITGGDSGIGRAAAIAYAREGADVAIGYLAAEESDAQDVAKYIREAGRKAVLLPGDIRDEGFCKHLVDETVKQLGGIDILVNNAGRQQSADSILDITTENFDWTFKTNVYAMFWITKAAVPHMPPGATIINTASVNAYDPSENLLDYSATKGAIAIFSKALAKQLAKKGIRVNAVAPGPFWTPLQVTGGQTPEKLEKFGSDTPLGRPGQPAEIATVYVDLASAEGTYITGQVYGAAGGRGNP
jgi:NAD(P)-dependent dehydrogenase (short-subunit alcohol dehydrogenase family)